MTTLLCPLSTKTRRIWTLLILGNPFFYTHGFSNFSLRLPTLVPTTTTTSSSRTQLEVFNNNNNNNNNPWAQILGNMALFSNKNSVHPNPVLDQILTEQTKQYSWTNLQEQLTRLQTNEEERRYRHLVEQGRVASPLNKIRRFDDTTNDVRVTFYRDSASWCPYCQKVWITLEQKKINYRVEKINMSCYGDKPASFLKLQPSGQIPVAQIDGKTYGQSNDIIYALETTLFPNHHQSLIPKNEQQRVQELLRLERQLFSAWLYWLTGSPSNRERFVQTLELVETEIEGPFFMGSDVTTVDIQFVPFVERMCASLLYFKGFLIRVPPGTPTKFPKVNQWMDAMETLPSYQLTKSDYYTHCWDLPPQLGGCTYEAAGEPYRNAINGERLLDNSRGSWELPLVPHNGGVEPDWTFLGQDDATACREAAERLVANHDAIVNFASRGAGTKGIPGVTAPLADPNATPNPAVQAPVDAVLRIVTVALLEGVEKHNTDIEALVTLVKEKGGSEDYINGVVSSLAYLRDRVGVPRDMRLPAARQLRAHLNWAIERFL